MTKDEAMKLALEALKQIDEAMPFPVAKLAQSALRKALASEAIEQPAQQEPSQFGSPKMQALILAKLAQPAQRTWVGLTADDLKEPKNGEQWRVEWWNESCRMMLPSDMKLDRFVVWKNGTVQFTIKKSAHGIKENT